MIRFIIRHVRSVYFWKGMLQGLMLATFVVILVYVLATLMGCQATKNIDAQPKSPVVSIPAPPTRAEGESIGDYRKRVEAEEKAKADWEIEQVKFQTESKIQQIKAQARIDAEQAKNDARKDFLEQTKKWTGWCMGILCVIAIVCIIGGLIPFVQAFGVSTSDGAVAFGAVAGLGILRYVLLQYGLLVGDVAAWCAIGLLIAGFGVVVWMIVRSLARGTLLKQAQNLIGAGHADAAVALEATAKGKTGQTVNEKKWRKAALVAAKAIATPTTTEKVTQ